MLSSLGEAHTKSPSPVEFLMNEEVLALYFEINPILNFISPDSTGYAKMKRWPCLLFSLFLNACDSEIDVYSLYRSSPIDVNMRIHIATFDAKNKNPYNQENCRTASELFAKQPGVTVKYWCEKGRYKN